MNFIGKHFTLDSCLHRISLTTILLKLFDLRYWIIREKATQHRSRLKKKYPDRIVAKLNNRKHSCRKQVRFVLSFKRITLRTKPIIVLIREPNKKLKYIYDMDNIQNSIQIEGAY